MWFLSFSQFLSAALFSYLCIKYDVHYLCDCARCAQIRACVWCVMRNVLALAAHSTAHITNSNYQLRTLRVQNTDTLLWTCKQARAPPIFNKRPSTRKRMHTDDDDDDGADTHSLYTSTQATAGVVAAPVAAAQRQRRNAAPRPQPSSKRAPAQTRTAPEHQHQHSSK